MKTTLLSTILLVAFLLSACGSAPVQPTPDVAFIQTSAANTVIANFTLTAKVPTNTPLAALTVPATPLESATPATTPGTQSVPTATLQPGAATPTAALCDYFGWDPTSVDVNIPDGTQMTPGQTFVKTWRIKNIGTCTWGAGYKLVYAGYTDQMSGVSQPINGVVGPGQEIEVLVQFKAPAKGGTYVSAWTMQNAAGVRFYGTSTDRKFIQKPLIVMIVVKI